MDASDKITSQLNELNDDWRGTMLKDLRHLINDTEPALTEDFKWGVPVWTCNGLVCAISAFKDYVKINFFKGAFLPDPKHQFNSGLHSKEHRSINLSKDEAPNTQALKELIASAVAFNNKK